MARRRLIIIAPTMTRANSLAWSLGLGSHEWIYIYLPENLLGYRHQEPENLFDFEYDVLVDPQMAHIGELWDDMRVAMDSAGLIYRMAEGDRPR